VATATATAAAAAHAKVAAATVAHAANKLALAANKKPSLVLGFFHFLHYPSRVRAIIH